MVTTWPITGQLISSGKQMDTRVRGGHTSAGDCLNIAICTPYCMDFVEDSACIIHAFDHYVRAEILLRGAGWGWGPHRRSKPTCTLMTEWRRQC